MHPDQTSVTVVVVDADRQPVYPCLARAGRGATLSDREPAEPAVGADVEIGAKCVEAGRLQLAAAGPGRRGRGPRPSPTPSTSKSSERGVGEGLGPRPCPTGAGNG